MSKCRGLSDEELAALEQVCESGDLPRETAKSVLEVIAEVRRLRRSLKIIGDTLMERFEPRGRQHE